MRLLLTILAFLLLASCSTKKESSALDYDFDKLELISYHWSHALCDIYEDTIIVHFFATVSKQGHCHLLQCSNKYHYYEFDIDTEAFQKILDRFNSINTDTILLTDCPFSGPYPDLNYILHKNKKAKILWTIGSYKYCPDSCFVDFYNYIVDIIKKKNYKTSIDTIEISNKFSVLIKGLYDRKIISLPPIIEK
jgi:hypothetical protein